jgi:hypothetical protein
MLEAVTRACCAGRDRGRRQVARGGGEQDVVDERALAGARDARDAHDAAEGEGDVDALEVVLLGALDDDGLLLGEGGAWRGPRSSGAREVVAGERAGGAMISATVPWAMMRPPWTPGPGPMSMTWSAARIMSSSCSTTSTVLPMSVEVAEGGDQAVVVALVQADGGLVEHVAGADEAASRPAWRGGCAGPRRRRGWRCAVEGEILEADAGEEAQAVADFRRMGSAMVRCSW